MTNRSEDVRYLTVVILGGYSQCQQFTTDWDLVVDTIQAEHNITSITFTNSTTDWAVVECEGGWEYQINNCNNLTQP